MWQNSYDNTPTLYLVPTPIGNMEDMSFRAINILKNVEIIFSEDTRVTANLLKYYDINKKMISLHEHNEESEKTKVLEYLNNGFSVALVTDRGTPIISDPGYKTVKFIIDKGFNVVAIPGACAFVPALISSGIPSSHFLFYGFLDSKISKQKKELLELSQEKNTMIFYEAPHRIINTLNNMLVIFGNRNISISREISKKFESIYHGDLEKINNDFGINKGEYVIVVEGNVKDLNNIELDDLCVSVDKYIKNGNSITEAIKLVAYENKLSKNYVYNYYHQRRKK